MSQNCSVFQAKILGISSIVLIALLLCQNSYAQEGKCDTLVFDHLIFFVSDATVENQLQSVLTKGDKLSTDHINQGTRSHFYLFLNTYIEFIYPVDSLKIAANEGRFGSRYSQRWREVDSVCRFGIGAILTPFEDTCSEWHTYRSIDALDHYRMSKSNEDTGNVFLYASSKEHRYPAVDTIEELDSVYEPPYLEDFKNYCQHPSGIEKLTGIRIFSPIENAFHIVNVFPECEWQESSQYRIELEFDRHRAGKSLELNDWLVINY